MTAYISRLALMQKSIQQIHDNHLQIPKETRPQCYYIFTERSLCTDYNIFAKMLYDQKKIEEINYQIYMKWFHHFAQHLPDTYIYIDTCPEICSQRIAKRSRTGEESIPLDYLTDCDKYHQAMFDNIQKNNKNDLLVLCGNQNDIHLELILQTQTYLQI
jgi:deoxyadenosine/deoxycytidine kinase